MKVRDRNFIHPIALRNVTRPRKDEEEEGEIMAAKKSTYCGEGKIYSYCFCNGHEKNKTFF